MYEKCITCDRLGKDCIPNLYVMEYEEIRDWARAVKEEKGITNAELARLSGVPKGTIDYNFSKGSAKHDVTYSTFAPILCALIGCTSTELPCGGDHVNQDQIKDENERLKRRLKDMKSEYDERIRYYRDALKWRKQMIIFLVVFACVVLSILFGLLAFDKMDGQIGFIWRD